MRNRIVHGYDDVGCVRQNGGRLGTQSCAGAGPTCTFAASAAFLSTHERPI
ncbi:hypothetical protein BH23GEM9_BH23GEM9_08810 [soil metagenome]